MFNKCCQLFRVIPIVVMIAGTVGADPVIVTSPKILPSGLDGFDLSIDPNGLVYDTIEVTITPEGDGRFNQADDIFKPFSSPGSEDTSLSLEMFGFLAIVPEESDTTFSGSLASLGDDSISSGTRILAQIVFQSGMPHFNYALAFADNGSPVGSVSGTTITSVPEATSSAYMAASALLLGLGVVGSRRWRSNKVRKGS